MFSYQSMIEIQSLTKSYPRVQALDGIDLSVESGGIIGLLGPNGAGKTTLVEILEGLREPSSGTVKVLGLDPKSRSKELRERIGVQLQSTSIPEDQTVTEILRLFGSFYGSCLEPDVVLEQVGLREKAHERIQRLSGGQKQRVAIAMALVHDPELILLDEPTTGLDPMARRELHEVIRNLQGRGRSVLLTTHYIEEAESLCDRVIVLRRGKIVADGPPIELLRASEGQSTIWLEVEGEFDPLPLLWAGTRPLGKEGRYHKFSTESPAQFVVALGKALQDNKFNLTDLRMRRPTLEDVYLELVGASGDGDGGRDGSGDGRDGSRDAGGEPASGESAPRLDLPPGSSEPNAGKPLAGERVTGERVTREPGASGAPQEGES